MSITLPMTKGRFKTIIASAEQGDVSLSDVAELSAAALFAQSESSKEIKRAFAALMDRIATLESEVKIMRRCANPVFRAITENYEDTVVKPHSAQTPLTPDQSLGPPNG